ncbi:ROK family transcriptional regulator [Gorillibacterium sp. sgz5001074]|uniref:ROK family transcriptional regulator n=1 Tax=Gorillibacterium sp. sgz5001074 TaxID=3446695 RepID=UPI003F679116
MEFFSTANKSLIKDINTATILQIVRTKGPISRAEISKLTGLNPATVSSNVGSLIENGLVRETGIGASSGGRKPMMIELNPDAYYVIGVDMGTTDVSTGITDLEGRIQHKVTLPFGDRTEPEEILGVIRQSIRDVMAASGLETDRFIGIGMGIHGLVDPDRGISLYAPAFQWEDVPIAEPFSREFGLPVTIDNDARAMALGEKWFGKAAEVGNFVFLNIGTGIGSGIYVNGELIRGAHFGAGEIGHIRVQDTGERCFCGIVGCLSTLASGPAIERQARHDASAGLAPHLLQLAGGEPGRITGELIHQAALQADAYAIRLLDEAGRHIGSALSVIVNLLNPEMVLIGGGVSNGGDFLFDGLKEEAALRSMANNIKKTYIGPAGLGDDCGMIGAAALILRSVFRNPNQYNS